jgi:SPP1 gp7 family putative phage head morphogenesis protein
LRQQKTIIQMVNEINSKIPEISKPRALTIARTEMSYSYNSALSKSYQTVGIDRWQWVSAKGYTSCADCIGLHGDVFNWGDPEPPLHPNCACSMYPVIDKEFKK